MISDLKNLLAINDEQVTAHIWEIPSKIKGCDLMVFEKNYRQISTFADLEQACRYLPQIFLPAIEIEVYYNAIDLWGWN
jgi:hypothetical protein